MSLLPPPAMAPTAYLHSQLALLIRRPLTAIALYGLSYLSDESPELRRQALVDAMGRAEAGWSLAQLATFGLIDGQANVTVVGREAIKGFEAEGFSPMRRGVVEPTPVWEDGLRPLGTPIDGGPEVFPSEAAEQLAELAAALERVEGEGPSISLTDREREILRLLAMGSSGEDITGELFISQRTLQAHVRAILEKLRLRREARASSEDAPHQPRRASRPGE